MTSVRWDDGMYTLKGNQQQKPLKINGWLVGWLVGSDDISCANLPIIFQMPGMLLA